MYRCPRCLNESVIILVTKQVLCCDRCRDYKNGIIPMSYNEEDERVYQVKTKRDD